jgi:broad specificity phosphatase PhoE
MLTKLVAILLLLAALGVQDAAPPSPAPARSAELPEPITVLCLRHAEKAAEPRDDPGLTPEGDARARELAALLARSGATHLFASELARAQATLAPLAAELALETRVRPAGASSALALELRALSPGSVAVVAGHSNTIPELVAALGGSARDLEAGRLRDGEFDRLFIVTIPAAGPCSTLELSYGARR